MSSVSSAFSTPSSTDVPPPQSTSGSNSTLRIVATIIPIVVIVAIVIWGLLVAAGVMHHRRGILPAPRAPLYTYREKFNEQLEEPKLWEVRTEMTEAKPYLEDLHPLSLELFSDTDSVNGHKRSRSWRKKDLIKQKRKWRDLADVSHPGPQSQEGQVTVFVAMPTPVGHQPGQPMYDFAIGTRPVIYTSNGEEKSAGPAEPSSSSSSMEVPIIMDMCTHGYIA